MSEYVGKHRDPLGPWVFRMDKKEGYTGKHRHVPSRHLPICVICFKRIEKVK